MPIETYTLYWEGGKAEALADDNMAPFKNEAGDDFEGDGKYTFEHEGKQVTEGWLLAPMSYYPDPAAPEPTDPEIAQAGLPGFMQRLRCSPEVFRATGLTSVKDGDGEGLSWWPGA